MRRIRVKRIWRGGLMPIPAPAHTVADPKPKALSFGDIFTRTPRVEVAPGSVVALGNGCARLTVKDSSRLRIGQNLRLSRGDDAPMFRVRAIVNPTTIEVEPYSHDDT